LPCTPHPPAFRDCRPDISLPSSTQPTAYQPADRYLTSLDLLLSSLPPPRTPNLFTNFNLLAQQ
jgi:hypothetical protein